MKSVSVYLRAIIFQESFNLYLIQAKLYQSDTKWTTIQNRTNKEEALGYSLDFPVHFIITQLAFSYDVYVLPVRCACLPVIAGVLLLATLWRAGGRRQQKSDGAPTRADTAQNLLSPFADFLRC